MSSIFEKNKTYIIIGVGALLFLALYIYLNSKNTKLCYQVDDLRQRVDDLEDSVQKYEKILKNPQSIARNSVEYPKMPSEPSINRKNPSNFNRQQPQYINKQKDNFVNNNYTPTEKHISFNTHVEEINNLEDDEENLDKEIEEELKELEMEENEEENEEELKKDKINIEEIEE